MGKRAPASKVVVNAVPGNSSGISTAASSTTEPPAMAAKKKTTPKNSKKSPIKRKHAATEESQDESMEQEQNLDKSVTSRKQKELPKPAIIINMHHPFPFKNQEYVRKKTERGALDEKIQYRPLKHIIGQERTEWDDIPSHPSYWTIKAPPRLKPAKKYSDISGLEALYTDPETKLHYCDAEEFEICRSLTRDLVQSYLRLRGFVDIIG